MNPTCVAILPSLPGEGWPSMNRYWAALAKCASTYEGSEFRFACPVKEEGILSNRAHKLKLIFDKKISYPLKIRGSVRCGIAHVLDHSYAFLLPAVPPGVKTIVTVHDLLPLREPDGLKPEAIARFRRRVEYVKRADLILAVSANTKRDLIELIGVDEEAIRLLPMAADLEWICESSERLPAQVDGEFIFSIGGYLKRKNLEILPRVLEQVRRTCPNVRLVRAGGKLPDALVTEFQQRCGDGALIELGAVSDEILSILYQSAAVTLIPSRYEGFGLPVLEAMGRRCPVVCAHTTSLPEVGGDVALYYEVDDAAAAAEQILSILKAEPEKLATLKMRGYERAKQFTWDIHFRSLLDIYRDVAAS